MELSSSEKLISNHRYSPHRRNVNVRLNPLWIFDPSSFCGGLHNFSTQKGKLGPGSMGTRGRNPRCDAKTHAESTGKGDPRPAKYQRLSREIERLCMEIRMYRLPPGTATHPATRFSNLAFKRFVARDRKKKEGDAGFPIYCTRSIIFVDAVAQFCYHFISKKW